MGNEPGAAAGTGCLFSGSWGGISEKKEQEEEQKQKEQGEEVPTEDEVKVQKAFGAQRVGENNDWTKI